MMDGEQVIILLAVVAAFALFAGLTIGYRMGRQLPPVRGLT